jgi:Glycosyltransferase (GlcNAc)
MVSVPLVHGGLIGVMSGLPYCAARLGRALRFPAATAQRSAGSTRVRGESRHTPNCAGRLIKGREMDRAVRESNVPWVGVEQAAGTDSTDVNVNVNGNTEGVSAGATGADPTNKPREGPNDAVASARIFVAIPCFRDRECGPTIEDLFAKAGNPGRISVGVCWQFDESEDAGLTELATPYRRQVRHRHFHFSESQGANWARVQAQDLWQGEDYVLQLDSHMRFMPRWDDELIASLERCPSRRALLSTLPAAYEPPATYDPELVHFRSLMHVNVLEHPFQLAGVQLAGGLYWRQTHPGLRRTPFVPRATWPCRSIEGCTNRSALLLLGR